MKARRYKASVNLTVRTSQGLYDVHMAIYSDAYRAKRLPKPPSPPLDPGLLALIRQSAVEPPTRASDTYFPLRPS
jgi:hypothetical protein